MTKYKSAAPVSSAFCSHLTLIGSINASLSTDDECFLEERRPFDMQLLQEGVAVLQAEGGGGFINADRQADR